MDNLRLQRLSVSMGSVREMIVQELRAPAAAPSGARHTLAAALELLEVLWAELRGQCERGK